MTFDYNLIPSHQVVQLLEQASACTGLTPDDIVALVDSELDTNYLLDYITAVVAKRMN